MAGHNGGKMGEIMLKSLALGLEKNETWLFAVMQVVGASIALALFAQVAIPLPFTPVPLSLQTLALFFIALTLGSKKASCAVVAYLAQGSLGLPVFAGGLVNPTWFMGPRAGYLLGFVLAAWVVGYLSEENQRKSFFKTLLILSFGEALILIPGTLWLGFFVGITNAIGLGALPFLFGDFLKILIVALAMKPVKQLLDRI